MKSTKTYVIGALIIAMSVIIVGLSLTYAYYTNSVINENEGNQGVTVTSGELSMSFESSQYISATSAELVEDTNITSTDYYTAFTISLPSGSSISSATYDLYLTDTSMTSNFKSSYLKWALYSGDSPIASGDFSGVTLTNEIDGVYDASDIALLSNVSISKGTTTSYTLYIWLSYDADTNQNELLDGSLSTKVGFTATSS